jgi:hypothetical protein
MRHPHNPATAGILIATLATGIGLSACGPQADNDEPGGLPRDTVPMTVPVEPARPDEPVDTTIPPRPTTAPEPPTELPPQPIGRSEADPASSRRSAIAASGEFSVDAGGLSVELAGRAAGIECAELRLTTTLRDLRSRWTESCIAV